MIKLLKKRLVPLLVAIFLILGTISLALCATHHKSSSTNVFPNYTSKYTKAENVTIYVVPAITDSKILPKSLISSSYISDTITFKASPGEFEPASFVILANQDINSMTIESTNLTGSGGTIPITDVDIRIVKCWYQGDYSNYMNYNNAWNLSVKGRYLTPELLLKDDSLIKVTGENWTPWNAPNKTGKNYLKLTNGSYIDISSSTPQNSNNLIIPISQRPIKDATTLKPVSILKGYNKQFWITLHVPDNANAGNYSGTITLRTGANIIRQLQLNLQVFPIILSKPNLEYSLYYRGRITDKGSLSSQDKTIEQFTAEMRDMLDHGVTNPSILFVPTEDKMMQVLSIRNQVGLNSTNLYDFGLGFESVDEFLYFKSLISPYGVINLYANCPDEQNISDDVNRSKITAIHKLGGKVMNAQSVSQADSVANILDLAIVSYGPSVELANKYHMYGHKVYSYANPQVVSEYPRLFRMNYGLLLWQKNYDGAMDYAYQQSYGDIWNDFDYTTYRDHCFVYPTMNGVIDTVQWEGFREGVDDVRYLTTLKNAIISAKSQGRDTSVVESWLANLKDSDLTYQDLNAIRLQMINYTLSLQN